MEHPTIYDAVLSFLVFFGFLMTYFLKLRCENSILNLEKSIIKKLQQLAELSIEKNQTDVDDLKIVLKELIKTMEKRYE